MRDPDFLIIGAQKAGTTWLATMLNQHPAVFLPSGEVHFFDKEWNYEKGLDWYRAQFDGFDRASVVGEKTPDYLWADAKGAEGHLPGVHRHIHRAYPDILLVAVLRDPVARAISAANHIIHSGRISPTCGLDDLLFGDHARFAARHGVIDKGFYARHLEAYLELFDESQLLVLIFEEDVVRDPAMGLARCCRFLGVDDAHPFRRMREKQNVTRKSWLRLALDHYAPPLRGRTWRLDRWLAPYKVRASAETRRRLARTYAAENERLFALLGRRVNAWERAA